MADAIVKTLAEKLASNLSGLAVFGKVVCSCSIAPIMRYKKSELPLAWISWRTFEPRYETSRYAYWTARFTLTIYYLAPEEDIETGAALLKAAVDKIGDDPTLDNLCEMMQVDSVVYGGEFPLYTVTVELSTRIERSISDV